MKTLPNIEHIESLFKQIEHFTDKEGKLFVPKILEAIDNVDSNLVKLLLSDTKAKKQFFMKVEDVYVLNQNELIEFFTMNEYFNHSFTSYTNKIGLIRKDNFIKKFDDVVLAFPYKDCVLEGGQSKEDEKKNEIFYNSIISRDEIDRLFESKVFTNVKRYDKEGEHTVEEIKEDDNLIIKGNNLLALYSLKKKYAGKVKLIYIDPPYNTGNDGFQYNDSFNHSTWLTFMKNRLEVAREFLSDDGVIFVQCDDNEQAYLKVLMDEVFGRDNFIGTIIRRSIEGGKQDSKVLQKIHDYSHGYMKTIEVGQLNRKVQVDFKHYNKKDKYINERGMYYLKPLENRGLRYSESLNYAIEYENKLLYSGGSPENNGYIWIWSKSKYLNALENDFIEFITNKNGDIKVYYKIYQYVNTDNEQIIRSNPYTTLMLDKYSNRNASNDIKKLFGRREFEYSKPENYLYEIINMSTNKNDLVMDFHLGSGTTCAVAHKMGRRYIGIEQMDYIEDIAVERMKKVIDGEQGGVSKALEWKGGGSFIYAELKTIDTFEDTPINKLNKNMQYLPITELEDKDYNISDEEIVLNKKFYGLDDE